MFDIMINEGEIMRKTLMLLILFVLSLLLFSCSKFDETTKDFEAMDTSIFFETVIIPERLSIAIDLDEKKDINKATIYQAEQEQFDQQNLIDTLIQNEIVEEKVWAEGPQIIAEGSDIQEVLSVDDGGEAFFGVKEYDAGGFNYSKITNGFGWNEMMIVANLSFINASVLENQQNSEYASKSDLGFLPYEKALADIEQTLDKIGLPTIKVDETYSLDLETMLSHYELYLNSPFVEEDDIDLKWTKDNESYIFSLQQLVDNIPIVNKGWQMPDGTKESAWGNPMPATGITLVYDQTGISNISAYGILDIGDKLETKSLINVYEALHTLVDAYSLTILEDEISIDSAELSYLAVPKDDIYELIPGWVFVSSKSTTDDGITSTEYKYDVVDAVTGKLYQDRW